MPCGLKTERLLLKASRYIILASLVISLTAVFFVANSFKRPHLNESRLYELAEEQEKFMENINTFFFERHKFKLKKYESSVLVRKNIDSLDHARGVKVDKDGLVILHSGLYFVHASVTPEFSSRVAYTTWSMYIYKMRRNSQARTIKLTDTAHTFLSWTNSQNTGYSAGVFKLEAGEKLQLRLTGQSLIACDERSTFLGLFMLTSSSSYQK
uniref:THD domain-containing protein n=1 Tax=Biomphalaria glabrata TaxID=6526 RepID=A0A2C9M238_BIOGL